MTAVDTDTSDRIDDTEVRVALNGEDTGGEPVSLEHLQRALAQERAKREEVERRLNAERASRTRAEGDVRSEQTARFAAEQASVDARMGGREAEIAALRKQISDAMAEGRFEDATELTDKLADKRAEHRDDVRYKTWLEGQKQARQAEPSNELDLSQYTPKQRAWIKDHPDFMTDETVRLKTQAGHALALAQGHAVDSPEYFEVIEQTIGGQSVPLRQDEDDGGDDDPPPAPKAAPRPRQAEVPVTRRQPNQPAASGRLIAKLTADEVESADITLSDAPKQGYTDQNGKWVPSRYERYAAMQARAKAEGRA